MIIFFVIFNLQVTPGICTGLKCFTEDIFGSSIFSFCHNSGLPVDGTTCGDNMHCKFNECVSKNIKID